MSLKHSKPERSTEPTKLTVPNKSPGYVGHPQTSDKAYHSRNIVRSLEQDLREEKSRNVVKKPHQKHYFTKILEDVDIIRGSTPPFIKNKTHLRESGNYHEISGKQTGSESPANGKTRTSREKKGNLRNLTWKFRILIKTQTKNKAINILILERLVILST